MSHQPVRSSESTPTRPLETAAWAWLNPGLVTATGPDAVRFVNNFTTAQISGLTAGSGTEGFFTDARGWVLALTTILRTDAGLLLVTDASRATALRDHLEHYHIREAVDLRDDSAVGRWLLVAGPEAGDRLLALGADCLPSAPAAHVATSLGGQGVRVIRTSGQGADGYWIAPLADGDIEQVAGLLAAAGLPEAARAELEAARIESGYPATADIPPKTLPQELGRDARAISFTKGCYLGQETVARLDAMGHVNRRLTRLLIATAEPPSTPAAIIANGTEVGTLTSACRAPRVAGCVGLGLVAVRALTAGDLTIGGSAASPLPPEGRS